MKRPVIDQSLGLITITSDGCLSTVTKQGLTVEVHTKCLSAPGVARLLIGGDVMRAVNVVLTCRFDGPAMFRRMLEIEVNRQSLYPIANLPGYSHAVVVKRLRAQKAVAS